MNRLLPFMRVLAVRMGTIILLATLPGPAVGEPVDDLFTGFQSQSKDPVQIDAASLEITEEGDQRISVFSGDVVVQRGETVLRAKTIRVFSPIGDNRISGQAFSRIEATGNVTINSGQQNASGAQVVVDMGKQTITMSGGVVLSQGANVITGDRLVVDLASGSARVEQAAGTPIRGVFTPEPQAPPAPGQ